MRRRGRSDNLVPSPRTCAVRNRHIEATSSYLDPRIRIENTYHVAGNGPALTKIRIQIQTGRDLFNEEQSQYHEEKTATFQCKNRRLFIHFVKGHAHSPAIGILTNILLRKPCIYLCYLNFPYVYTYLDTPPPPRHQNRERLASRRVEIESWHL